MILGHSHFNIFRKLNIAKILQNESFVSMISHNILVTANIESSFSLSISLWKLCVFVAFSLTQTFSDTSFTETTQTTKANLHYRHFFLWKFLFTGMGRLLDFWKIVWRWSHSCQRNYSQLCQIFFSNAVPSPLYTNKWMLQYDLVGSMTYLGAGNMWKPCMAVFTKFSLWDSSLLCFIVFIAPLLFWVAVFCYYTDSYA